MSREIQSIPISPRDVPWAHVIWFRWPLLRTACALVALGSLWAWMLYLGSLGGQAQDEQLDRVSRPGTARITEVVPQVRAFDGKLWDRASYELVGHGSKSGDCFVPSGRVEVGEEYPAELHTDNRRAHINRLAGGRRYLIAWWARPDLYLGLVIAPGLALVIFWLIGAIEVRRLLADGDVSLAEVTDSRSVGIAPPMLLVTFRYRDHRAHIHTARHRVRTQSVLGIRLRRGEHRFPVVVHRRWPRAARLVVASDFERRPATRTNSGRASMET